MLATGGKAGETKSLAFEKDVSVTELEVTFRNKVSRLVVTVEKLPEKPQETPKPQGKIYTYLKIDKDIQDEDISRAKIRFKVENGWLARNGLLPDEITLQRYQDEWQELPTKKTRAERAHTFYEAETKGFSYFAITSRARIAPTETAEIVQQHDKPTEQKATEASDEPERKDGQNRKSRLKYIVYLIILLSIAGTAFFNLKRKYWKH